MSHARKRFQTISAAVAAAAVAGPTMTMDGANAYELQLAQLHQDRLRLSQIQSTEGKVALKVQLLPAYAPYVEGVLAGGRGAQDDVLTTIMVWRIDVGDFAGALDIGEYVLKHGMTMPDRFERNTACMLAEEIAEEAIKAHKAGSTFSLTDLNRAAQLTAEHDMPDQARSKLHLALGRGYAWVAENDPEADQAEWAGHAKRELCRAIELHDKCGAKKDLERIERVLKKHAESKPATTGTGEPSANDQPKPDQGNGEPNAGGAPSETGNGEQPANDQPAPDQGAGESNAEPSTTDTGEPSAN